MRRQEAQSTRKTSLGSLDPIEKAVVAKFRANLSDHIADSTKHITWGIPLPYGAKLWHFDSSLVSTDGTAPEPGAVATLRPGEGRFGGAVAVEEGTTNLVDFDVAFWSWSSNNSNMASLTTKTGRHSFRVQGTSTVPGAYSFIYPDYATTNVLHSASSWVRNLNSKPLEVRLQIRDGSNGESLSDNVVVVVPPGQELPIRVTSYSPVSLNRVTVAWTVYSDPDDGTVDAEIYMCQLESKPFATSFVDGTRADGRLVYPRAIPSNEGTLLIWAKKNTLEPNTKGGYRKILDAQLPRIDFQWEPLGNLSANFGGANVSIPDPAQDLDWHQYAITYSGRTVKMYFDGQLVASGQAQEDLVNFSELCVGARWDGYGAGNALYDELLVAPFAATPEQIQAWYAMGAPFWDPWIGQR